MIEVTRAFGVDGAGAWGYESSLRDIRERSARVTKSVGRRTSGKPSKPMLALCGAALAAGGVIARNAHRSASDSVIRGAERKGLGVALTEGYRVVGFRVHGDEYARALKSMGVAA